MKRAFYKDSNNNWIIGDGFIWRGEGIFTRKYSDNNTKVSIRWEGKEINGLMFCNITDIEKNDQGDKYTSFAEFDNAVAPFFVNAPLEWGNITGSIANQVDLININNLINYYLKSETYTKQEVNQLLNAINLADLDNYDPNKVFNIQLDNGEITLEEVV